MPDDIVKQPPKTEVIDQAVVPQSAQIEVKQSPIDAESPQPVAPTEAIATQAATEQPLPIHNEPRHTPTRPLGIIGAAVVVCLCLVGAAFYGGMTQTESGKSVKTQNNAAATTTKTSTSNLDSIINDASSINDDSQASNADLTDQSIGL